MKITDAHYKLVLNYFQQLTQMAPPATIIGQIQATQTAPGTLQQVANASQLQQLQAGVQPTLTISTAPQQVPLPATIPPVTKEEIIENAGTDGISQSGADMPKENGINDGKCCLVSFGFMGLLYETIFGIKRHQLV